MLLRFLFRFFFVCLLFPGCAIKGYANLGDFLEDINFEHISVDKGLSSTSVYDINQTDDGFLWIATQNGLNRYDGYNFKVFNFVPGDKTSLSNNWVKDLCKDNNGNLWVGTSSGLNKYHAESETFSSYFNDSDLANSLADNNIWSLHKDRDGHLWIGTNNGLSLYNEAKNEFINYYITAPDTKLNNAINSIAEDKNGNLWVGTWGDGFFLFDKKKGTFRNFADITSIQAAAKQYVKALKFDGNGILWIGTHGNGLHRFDPVSKEYRIFKTNAKDPGSISDDVVLTIMEDRQGELWIGTHSAGVNRLNKSDFTFKRYQTDFLKSHSLQGQWITSFYEDKGGNIWIGHDHGISKFNPFGPKFLHFKNNPFDANSVPNSNIGLIYESKDGMLWIGTWGAGLTRFNRFKNVFTHFKPNPNIPGSLSDRRVWGMCEDMEGNIWVATSGGLERFNKADETFTHFNDLQKNNPAAQINFTELSSIAVDKKNRMWIGTWGGGFYLHDLKTSTTYRYLHSEADNNSLSNDRIKQIFIDSKQNVWFSTSEGGLEMVQVDENGNPLFKHFRYKANDKFSIGSDSPQVVYEDSRQRIWIGTEGGGLCFYNPEKDNFTRIHIRETLPTSNSVYGILEDESRNLWLSTNNGIIHYNPAMGHSKSFDVSDGLQGNTFLSGHCKTKDGAMLFGGHNGFNLFFPSNIKESNFQPTVLLSELRIFNELIEVGKPHKNTFDGEKPVLPKPLFLCDEITLTYKDYVLSFSFTSLDFASPQKNKFAYMLENFEDEWNYTDASKRYATYTNLQPGEYILKVKGTNSDGLWNNQMASLKVIVKPPFWQTWWFKTTVFVIFGILVFIIHRMWLQVKLENLLAMERVKVQEAEAIRKKVAMDFHDEMGNQLASITALINLITIRQSKKDYNIEDLLAKLNQHAQTLFYGTKDFIWSIDPKSDKAEVILLNIKDFGDDLFDRTGISFHFFKDLHDPNLIFPAGTSRHITLICKEIFTNIVKHAGCNSVQVQAISTGEVFSISIKDDGCGFDMEKLRRKGNGLENMQTRAKKINAEIDIHSLPGLGTEITLHVLIPKKGEDKKKLILDLNN